jgi:cell division protein FtsZ
MRDSVDTILVISNDKLRQSFGNLGFKEAFSKADDILATATRCITDVINSRGHVIVDFADVCTVMRDGGTAILGSAAAIGDDRAQKAVEQAISSPLLNDHDISGAKWVLLNITSGEGDFEHTLDEMDVIQNYIQMMAGEDCDVILGTGYDNNLGEAIGVTIIATGFTNKELGNAYDEKKQKPEEIKVVRDLNKSETTSQQAVAESSAINTATPTAETAIIQEEIITPDIVTTIAGDLKTELAPTLSTPIIEEPIIPTVSGMGMRPVTPAIETQKVVIDLEANIAVPEAAEVVSELPQQQPQDMLRFSATTSEIKDDFITIDGITINRRLGSRYMSDREIMDKITFELEKKAFDDRASKLRGLSHNFGVGNPNDQMEHIPSFQRLGKPLPENGQQASSELSNYKVDANNQIDGTDTHLSKFRPC